jgi:hypothetical protein
MNIEPEKRVRLENVARLALHQATPEKEWQAGAIAFFRILRTSKETAETLLNGSFRDNPQYHAWTPPPPRRADPPKPKAGTYYFPYGRHKNVPIHLVPESYLIWALRNIRKLSPKFKHAIEQELFDRSK